MEVNARTGQETVAGQGLNFNGSNPVALPNGLISDATTLAVDVTFQTTSDGVILGYQNQPTSLRRINICRYFTSAATDYSTPRSSTAPSGRWSAAPRSTTAKLHTADLVETGSSQSLYPRWYVGRDLSGTPNPLNMTYDQLGMGYTLGYPNAPAGYFPFTGTIDQVQITEGSLLTGSVSFPANSNNQITFTPPAPGTDTIGLSATDVHGGTGAITASLTATDVPPSPTITGLPTSSPAGMPIFLTGSATDLSPSTAAAGLDYLWSVSAGTGQQVVAGQDLTFNGSNPIALPAGLINGATTLTVDVTFQTTAGGVILGYQNRPLGTTPSQWVPALYVGTNGLLYAEIWNGGVHPITSTTKVNDGQQHVAVLTLSGSTETLTLDGNTVGTLTGSPQPLAMTFDELGTGETADWPAGTGGFDPFVGTIGKVQITSGTMLAGSVTFPSAGGNP